MPFLNVKTYAKYPIDVLGSTGAVDQRNRRIAQHFINSAYNVQHFLFADVPVTVRVVQFEYPANLLLVRSSRYLRQHHHEILMIAKLTLTIFS
jgi:hypothetical protein